MEIGIAIIVVCVIAIAGLFVRLVHNEKKIDSMTDKEKLEKVRAEIERRIESIDRNIPFGLNINADFIKQELERLLLFIGSIQEECNITGIKSKEATGKLKECIDNVSEEGLEQARKQLEEELVNGGLDLGCGVIWKDEKSASEDIQKVGSLKSLEYYPEKKTTNKTSKGVFDANMPRRKAYLRGFKDGAHAHKELIANKPVSEDLEEVSKKYSSCIYLEEVLSDDDKEVLKERLVNNFKAGAEWQKQQMMAKAVEGVAACVTSMEEAPYVRSLEGILYLKGGDKVKLIVIKED